MNYKSFLEAFLRMVVAIFCFGTMAVYSQPMRQQNGNDPSPIFNELSDRMGLKFRHYNGMTGKLFLPEVMGAGVALFDFDNDGDLDVFLVQGATLEAGDQ